MKPPDFDYGAPTSLDDALTALRSDNDATVLAGGQSLIPLLAFRLAWPTLLVDLARVDQLTGIVEHDDRIVIGSMTRQRQIERDAMIASRCPLLSACLGYVGHPQIRSRGTIGGSLAHADPAAELPAVVLALDGKVRVVGSSGERTIEAADLFNGFLTTSLRHDEILVDLELPVAPPRAGSAVVEIARRPGDFALCGAVAQVEVSNSNTVVDARLALIGVGDRPVRATAVEEAMVGGASPQEAARFAAVGLHPTDDTHASADYRLHLAEVVSKRVLTKAMENAR